MNRILAIHSDTPSVIGQWGPTGKVPVSAGKAWAMLICIVVAGLVGYPSTIALSAPDEAGLPDTIQQIKPSIVGVGTYLKTRRPPGLLLGTGFVVKDGRHVLTNAHVLPEKLDEKHQEFIAVFTAAGGRILNAGIAGLDPAHDLGLLHFDGPPLPPLVIGDDARVREGALYAFTGYPLGALLGLNAVTHRGIVSAITPLVIPVTATWQLDGAIINHLKEPNLIFQLDATAYPGNSGSPLYDVITGRVIGIINKVFVKGLKEHAITNPSGITYAIPSRYIKTFLNNCFTRETRLPEQEKSP